MPDEKFAQILGVFDEKLNFNLAMGESFGKTQIYKKLNATCKYIEQDSKENYARLKREGDEFYIKLRSIYSDKSKEVDVLEFLKEYKESFKSKKEIKVFDEELYSFKNILPFMREMSVKSVINLFMQRLSKER